MGDSDLRLMWMMAPPAAVMCGSDVPLTIGARTGIQGSRPVRTQLPVEITLERADGELAAGHGSVVSSNLCYAVVDAGALSIAPSSVRLENSQLEVFPREEEAASDPAAPRRPGALADIIEVTPNRFQGLQTNKINGEVSFVVRMKELTAVLGSRLILRARVAGSSGSAKTVVEAISQPFEVV